MISGISDISVRKATLEDLDSVKTLADAHRHELGFVRRSALARAIDRQEIIVAYNHEGFAGFVEYYSRRDTQTTLYHIAIKPEHRLQGVGQALIEVLKDEAQTKGKDVIRLKCPADLTANRFYERLGFTLASRENNRNRPLNVWELQI